MSTWGMWPRRILKGEMGGSMVCNLVVTCATVSLLSFSGDPAALRIL